MSTLTYPEAMVVGLLQGVSELFPVSSLGHSVLIPAIIGGSWAQDLNVSKPESPYLAFIVGLHVATASAMILYYWRDWLRIIGGFLSSIRYRRVSTTHERLAWMIILATIPVGIAGLALEHIFRVYLSKPWLTSLFLIANGVILILGDRRQRARARAVPAYGAADPVLQSEAAQSEAGEPGMAWHEQPERHGQPGWQGDPRWQGQPEWRGQGQPGWQGESPQPGRPGQHRRPEPPPGWQGQSPEPGQQPPWQGQRPGQSPWQGQPQQQQWQGPYGGPGWQGEPEWQGQPQRRDEPGWPAQPPPRSEPGWQGEPARPGQPQQQRERGPRATAEDPAIAADRRLSAMSYGRAVLIGAAQILALCPGISRDGIVMVTSMRKGLSRQDAVRYSFLLSAPVILAAGALKVKDLFGPLGTGIHGQVAVGSLLSFVGAFFAVWFLTRYVGEAKSLRPFGIYCVIAGLFALFFVLAFR